MTNPYFSFVMGVKDAGNELQESISSIVNQTFREWELILIDDGSKNKDLLIQLAANDSRIKLFHQENMGLTKTLIKGIGLAQGDYIVRQDADDISPLNRLSKLHEVIQSGGFDVVFSRAKLFGDVGLRKITPGYLTFKGFDYDLLSFGNMFIHGSFCMKRECFVKYNYNPSYRFAQDYDLFCRVMTSDFKIGYLKEPLYLLRKASFNISSKSQNEQLETARAICLSHFKTDKNLIASTKGFKRVCLHLKRALLCLVGILKVNKRIQIL